MRVTDVSINGTDRYSSVYNAKGQIAEVIDLVNNEKTVYTYDMSGRLLRISQTGGKSISTGYDILNRVTAINYQFAGETKTVSFGYGQDGQKGESTLLSGATQTATYDTLGRETASTVGDLTRSVSYLNVSGNRTTTLPQTLTYTQDDATLLSTSYAYDVRGNIATMTVDGVTYTYTYDSLNQLTGVTTSDNSFTATYSYDNGGNILSKTVNGVTTAYGYTDTNWKDKLTSYNGHAITYDGMGNPLTSYQGDFSWDGRQMEYADNPEGLYAYYTYNESGIRTRKDVYDVVTDYFLDGSTILAEKTGSNVIWYIYDTGGELLGFTYNGTPYYYLKNMQGDVYKIVDANGTVVGSYTYDPWGKVLTATGTMAEINPIRYRSYYYDSETELYYLQSRYYDPELGRFINADALVSTGQGLLGNNMFAYCLNNPVCMKDVSGTYATYIVVYDTETTLVEDDNGTCYYETTISYIVIVSYGPAPVFFVEKQVAKFEYSISPEGIVAFDNSQEYASLITINQICDVLTEEMRETARTQVPNALNGRTIAGMTFEMQAHYYGSLLGIKSGNTDITHLASNIKDSIGYRDNDDWFENPIKNLPNIIKEFFPGGAQ